MCVCVSVVDRWGGGLRSDAERIQRKVYIQLPTSVLEQQVQSDIFIDLCPYTIHACPRMFKSTCIYLYMDVCVMCMYVCYVDVTDFKWNTTD